MNEPRTLQEAIEHFADYRNCHDFLVAIRWPAGVTCPHCGSPRVRYMESVRRWQCYEKHPRPQFSLKTGSVIEDSPIALKKWLTALWLIVNAKNGISSYEVHRAIGVTQKSAWFMMHRLRAALHTGSFEKMLGGEVEVDETFIGGKARNMHSDVRARRITGRGPTDKTVALPPAPLLGRAGVSVQRAEGEGLGPLLPGDQPDFREAPDLRSAAGPDAARTFARRRRFPGLTASSGARAESSLRRIAAAVSRGTENTA